MVRLPQGLTAWKQVAKEVSLDLEGASLNLDGGFDSTRNRQCIFNAGLLPNIPEKPRNRKRPFAWEDKCKRRRLRFERMPQRHYGMTLLGYTMINLRGFCGV